MNYKMCFLLLLSAILGSIGMSILGNIPMMTKCIASLFFMLQGVFVIKAMED